MNNINKGIKKGFSLLELTICILIVSIIVVVCVPLIMDQMKKTNEYAYFLGFKTVEKLGSQIVAFGDPDSPESVSYKKQDILQDSYLKKLIAKKIENVTNKIMPQAIAHKTILISFPSYEYDTVRLCNGNNKVVKDYMSEAGNEFTEEEIGTMNCGDNIYKDSARLNKRFSCNGGTIDVKTLLATTEMTAREFCDEVAADCASVYSTYHWGVDHEYKIFTLNQAGNRSQYGQCTVFLKESTDVLTGLGGAQTSDEAATLSDIQCSDYGYPFGIEDIIGSGCECSGVPSINHPNICCEASQNNNLIPYSNADGECIYCAVGTYNEETGSCCPQNSYYSRTIGHCACAQGYQSNNENDVMECNPIIPIQCPTGFHPEPDADAEDAVCVVNPPITKASKFCQLIANYYNITQSNCGTFNDVETFGGDINPVSYNQALFNAITANNTPYLSAKAVEGAFNNINPNIVFSNGLKLWILGDKVASIAGLSFNPIDYTPDINVCVNRRVYTKEECDLAGDNHYFCKDGNHCFTINKGESEAALEDARSCCPTVDYEDLHALFAGNTYLRDPRVYAVNGFTVFVDVTGDKDREQGGGTLWKDVFPFYVSANGTVYPGYPLDANKEDISAYQGGNSSALNSDVYYYEIVGGERKKRLVYTSIPYSRAQCFALQVSAYTPYCQNLGTKFKGGNAYNKMDKYIYSEHNPCWKHRCYVHVKNKIKFL